MNAIAEAPHNGDLAAKRRQFMSQPSTVATRRQQAVCVRRAHKQYGSKKNPNIILDGLNMTVPKGSMYVNLYVYMPYIFRRLDRIKKILGTRILKY